MDEMRAKGAPLLVLELGDFMAPDSLEGSVADPFMLDSMEREGMAAMIPGVLELTHWPRFQRLMAGREIPLVSSNVRLSGPGGAQSAGQRSLVVDVGGVRVGLLGVIGAAEFARVSPAPDISFEFQPPLEAIEELMPDLAPRCDLVALMACMDDKTAAALAREVRGVAIILGGYQSIASDRPLRFGEVIVSRSGMRGQYLSTTRLILSPQNEILDWGGSNQKLLLSLAPDPEIDAQVTDAVARGLRARLRFSATRRPPRPGGPRGYLGEAVCRSCHGEPHAQWAATPHAQAWETLTENGKSADPACVACHSTGLETGGHPISGNVAQELQGVQCEACHGPGAEHARGAAARAVNAATCRTCHTAVWSPDWDYGEAREQVRH